MGSAQLLTLQVLHCVMYPRAALSLPILAFDMVGAANKPPSLCIADLCPVTEDMSLPAELQSEARCGLPASQLPSLEACSLIRLAARTHRSRRLQEQQGLASNRMRPPWGQELFSDSCLLMRPDSDQDTVAFTQYVCGLLALVLEHADARCVPHVTWRVALYRSDTNLLHRHHADGPDPGSLAGQQRFCRQQMLNQKTRRMLGGCTR